MKPDSQGASVRRVLEVLGRDDVVEREIELTEAEIEIGRRGSGVSCPDDSEMADTHARLSVSQQAVELSDSGEGSGVWLRLKDRDGRALESGDQIWLGAQILLVRRDGSSWQLRHHGPDGRLRETYTLSAASVFVGRASDWVLDESDARLSRRHAQLVVEGTGVRLFDRGAFNGTFVKLRAPEALADGDEFRVASHRFRVATRPIALAEPIDQEDPLEAPTLIAEPLGSPDVRAAEPDPAPAAPRPGPQTGPGLGARLRKLGQRVAAGAATPPAEAEETVLETLQSVEPVEEPAGEAHAARNLAEETVLESFDDPDEADDWTEPEAEDETDHETEDVAQGEAEEGGLTSTAPVPSAEETVLESVERVGHAEATVLESFGQAEQALEGQDTVTLVLESAQGAISLEARIGQTVVEAAQDSGLARGEPLDWECGDGGCGVCVMGVIEGADQMDPPDPASGEMKTIQITEQVTPDATKYRLACLARLRGPVRLRRLQ